MAAVTGRRERGSLDIACAQIEPASAGGGYLAGLLYWRTIADTKPAINKNKNMYSIGQTLLGFTTDPGSAACGASGARAGVGIEGEEDEAVPTVTAAEAVGEEATGLETDGEPPAAENG